VYHNGTANNVFSNGKNIHTSKPPNEVLGEICTQEVISTENFDSIWRTNSLVSSDKEEERVDCEPVCFIDIVGDLK
jgi:hypothetical protein